MEKDIEPSPEFHMHFLHKRLASYIDWPFDDNCACTPERMAAAGFFHCPTENEPDLVKCFVCLKELDGWEPSDDPWIEHKNHSNDCPFLEYCNPQNPKKMTIENFFRLEKERQLTLLRKEATELIEQIPNYAAKARKEMKTLV